MNSLTLYFAWERGALSAVGDGEKNGPIRTRYCNHTCVISVDCNCANFVGNKGTLICGREGCRLGSVKLLNIRDAQKKVVIGHPRVIFLT